MPFRSRIMVFAAVAGALACGTVSPQKTAEKGRCISATSLQEKIMAPADGVTVVTSAPLPRR